MQATLEPPRGIFAQVQTNAPQGGHLVKCSSCGAVVQQRDQRFHHDWHALLFNALHATRAA